MSTFATARVEADGGPGGPFFFYNVDDITTSAISTVPEPSTLTLLLAGMLTLGLVGTGGRRRKEVQ